VFENPLHEEFASWALGFAPYGGADVSEVAAIAAAVGDGGDDAFYDARRAAADRLASEANDAEAAGHVASAREYSLHAACFYAVAYHPIYGVPVDPRLVDSFHRQIKVFDTAMRLTDPPVEPVSIPYEHTTMPAYLVRARDHERETRPLLIGTNGYDATVTEMYFTFAAAAADRGYHCLFFDGPGQGKLLIDDGMPMRADWEHVVTPVIDHALGLDGVDPDRIALTGWSLGGYLALRAASSEHRLAACIADPGTDGMWTGFVEMAKQAGLPQKVVDALPRASQDTLAALRAGIDASPHAKWGVMKRGFWVNGADNLGDWLEAVAPFTLSDRARDIRCPTLLTTAENDALGKGAPALLDELTCPKALLEFTAAEGAGDHCEILNRSLLNRRVFDWLDGIFGV
jgi:alpha-beta hydrolase superfamily lysophospholipase